MLQHHEGSLLDLTERDLAAKRKVELNQIDLAEAITFKARSEEAAEIFVFTDVSCGYCRKLHRHIKDITESGITVHYLAFPRAGSESSAGELMSRVWCAKDRQRALTTAKRGGVIKQKTEDCDDPVSEQHELGLVVGVSATPSIYDHRGQRLGGYLTPSQLARALD